MTGPLSLSSDTLLCRAGAVAKLRRGHYRGRPGRRQLYFQEKGGRHEDIEVRGDLEEVIDRYLAFARMKTADPKCPLFRPLLGTTQAFREWVPATNAAGDNEQGAMSPNDSKRTWRRNSAGIAGLDDGSDFVILLLRFPGKDNDAIAWDVPSSTIQDKRFTYVRLSNGSAIVRFRDFACNSTRHSFYVTLRKTPFEPTEMSNHTMAPPHD